MIQAVYQTRVSGGKFYLPKLGEVWETLGILDNQPNTNFCCELIIINQSRVSQSTYNPQNFEIWGDNTPNRGYDFDLRTLTLNEMKDTLPIILRRTGDRYLEIEGEFLAHFFITYINGRYIANYIYG
jgi:hypothetical protein